MEILTIILAICASCFCLDPLHRAVKHGQYDIAKSLLDANWDVETKDDGITPLHVAVSTNFKNIARLLLKYGANINALDSAGKTPLMLCIGSGHWDMGLLLMRRKANPTLADKEKTTPLHVLAKVPCMEKTPKTLKEALKEAGNSVKDAAEPVRNVEASLSKGKGRFDWCNFKYYTDSEDEVRSESSRFRQKKNEGKSNSRRKRLSFDWNRKSADFGEASSYGPEEKAKPNIVLAEAMICQGSANINALDQCGKTALFYAIETDEDLAMFLIKKDADVNVAAIDGKTPLHMAVTARKAAIVRALIEKGAKHKGDNRLWTPLHESAFQGDLQIAKILAEYVDNVDMNDSSGATPKGIASREGHGNVCEYLACKYYEARHSATNKVEPVEEANCVRFKCL